MNIVVDLPITGRCCHEIIYENINIIMTQCISFICFKLTMVCLFDRILKAYHSLPILETRLAPMFV